MKNSANRTINERRIRPSDPTRREPLERRAGFVRNLVANTDDAIRHLIPDIDQLPEVTGIVPEAAAPVETMPSPETAMHIAQSVLGGDGAASLTQVETSPAISKDERIENAMKALHEVHGDENKQEGANVAV
jgi:hypothetical protein